MDASTEDEDADPVGEPIAAGPERRAHQGRVLRAIMDSATEDDLHDGAHAGLQAQRSPWSDWAANFRDEWVRLAEGNVCPFQTADLAYHLWVTYKHEDPATIAGKVWSGDVEEPHLPPPD